MSLTDNTTVLLIEDEESYVEALTIGLRREGYAVQVARTGIEGLKLMDDIKPDLVLLDLMLPGVSGIDVCREIRSRYSVPVIMVTAKTSEIDTVVGLEVGADDYITKPYRLGELVARMRAALRRSSGGTAAAETPNEDLIVIGDLELDEARHEVRLRGKEVQLPLREFEVLELLMSRAGRVISRASLIDSVWGSDYVGDSKTLDVHIKRLRAKIEDDPADPKRITTIRGLGYRFQSSYESGEHTNG